MTPATKSQHYVPQKYLCQWATDGQIAMVNDKKVIPRVAVKNVAQENYFYKYEDLKYSELVFVVSYLRDILKMPAIYLQMHLTSMFSPILFKRKAQNLWDTGLQRCFDFLKQEHLLDQKTLACFSALDKIIASGKEIFDCPQLDQWLKNMINNGAERLNCDIEDNAWPYFTQALSGDLSFANTEDGFDKFVLFLIYQLFRTNYYFEIASQFANQFDVEGVRRICSYIRYPRTLQTHANLLKDRSQYDLSIVNNTTELKFITGDQPLVNLDRKTPQNFFDLFYPISPNKALLLSKKGRFDAEYPYLSRLTSKDVDFLNKNICSVCTHQVYASCVNILLNNKYSAGMSPNPII